MYIYYKKINGKNEILGISTERLEAKFEEQYDGYLEMVEMPTPSEIPEGQGYTPFVNDEETGIEFEFYELPEPEPDEVEVLKKKLDALSEVVDGLIFDSAPALDFE